METLKPAALRTADRSVIHVNQHYPGLFKCRRILLIVWHSAAKKLRLGSRNCRLNSQKIAVVAAVTIWVTFR